MYFCDFRSRSTRNFTLYRFPEMTQNTLRIIFYGFRSSTAPGTIHVSPPGWVRG